MMPTPQPRSEKLDLRLTPQAKQRLYAAAQAAQRSVSDFVLHSALERADETLADRRVFSLARADDDRRAADFARAGSDFYAGSGGEIYSRQKEKTA